MDQDATADQAGTRWWERRQEIFATAIGIWLAGFWVIPDGWWHRLWLACIVFPALVWTWGAWRPVLREERWLWLAGVLMGWQWLSRWWSPGSWTEIESWTGSLPDVMMVGVVLLSMLLLARDGAATRRVFGWMVLAAAVAALVSMLGFYAMAERSIAEDRLRNVLVYYGIGMNPVLTGLLFAFGALGAGWLTGRTAPGRWRRVWFGSLVVLTLGMCAAQSRGAFLMFGAGGVMLLVLERRRVLAAAGTVVLAVAGYFGVLMWATAGIEAARDLLDRGATGRFEIYGWFLQQMDGVDRVIGRGMALPPIVPEEQFGWFIEHPHSAYLTQFYLTGGVGVVLLVALLGWGGWAACQMVRRGESLWLVLLAGGAVGMVFDGGQILSVCSEGRLEVLLLVIPAAMAVGRMRSTSLLMESS